MDLLLLTYKIYSGLHFLNSFVESSCSFREHTTSALSTTSQITLSCLCEEHNLPQFLETGVEESPPAYAGITCQFDFSSNFIGIIPTIAGSTLFYL